MTYHKVAGGVVLAAGAAWLLWFSHRQAYSWGERSGSRPIVEGVRKSDEDAEARNLYYSVLMLRLLEGRPRSLPAEGIEDLRQQAESCIEGVESRVIPRQEKEGRTTDAEQNMQRVAEARRLLGRFAKVD